MALTFQFAPISRLFYTRHADWIVGIAAAAIVVAGLIVGPEMPDFAFFTQPANIPFLGVVLWCGLSGFFGVRAWRRLWRRGRTPIERCVYDLGVRGFGALMLLSSPLLGMIVAWSIVSSLEEPITWRLGILAAFTALVVMFPLSLWAGFIFGSVMPVMLPYRQLLQSTEKFDDLPPAA